MKRKGYIYESVCDLDNIRKAIHNASKGKKHKRLVKKVLNNEDKYVEQIHFMLVSKTFKPSPYSEMVIKDGLNRKERIIHKPKFFPDQIIHWCLIQEINGLMLRGMYKWSCASIPGRGTHYAKNQMQRWLRNDKKRTKYCIKLDIKKYYPSINKEILKSKFRRLIKCKDTLNLIDIIIDSHVKGLPIGNYTSQWFANFYLQDIDHYIKQKLEVSYYMRYMDDLVLLSGNKRKLKKSFFKLKEELLKNNLEVKNNYQFFQISKRNLDFVGFVFNHQKTFIRKRITLRCRRRILRYRKKQKKNSAHAIMSYFGWYKHSNSYILKKQYFYKEDLINRLKEVIGDENRKKLIDNSKFYAQQVQNN